MKRNAFGQLIQSPNVRTFADEPAEGGGGNEPKPFTAPASQEELDRIVTDRVSRAERKAREEERGKFKDYDAIKADADKYRAANAPKPKDEAKPTDGVSPDDVDKRINEALAAERLELALERVNDRLDKALEGRTFSASALFSLDRKQFVKDDGKTVDADALKDWVKDNSTETPKPGQQQVPGQGKRGESTEIEAGRSAYERRHPKKK